MPNNDKIIRGEDENIDYFIDHPFVKISIQTKVVEEPIPEVKNAEPDLPKKKFVGIENFQDRMFGTNERFQELRNELFVRTVATIFSGIKKGAISNVELDDFVDGKGLEVELLRRISRIRKSKKISSLEGEIEDLDKLLQLNAKFPVTNSEIIKFNDKGGFKLEPGIVDISQKLQGALNRLKKLDTIRANIASATLLEQEVGERGGILEVDQTIAYEATVKAEDAKKLAIELTIEADRLTSALVNNQATLEMIKKLLAQTPKRRIRRSVTPLAIPTTNKETPSITNQNAWPTIPGQIVIDDKRQIELELAEQEEQNRLNEALRAELEQSNIRIEGIVNGFVERIQGFAGDERITKLKTTLEEVDRIIIYMSDGDISLEIIKSLTSINLQSLLNIIEFESVEQAALVLPRIKNILFDKLSKIVTDEADAGTLETINSLS